MYVNKFIVKFLDEKKNFNLIFFNLFWMKNVLLIYNSDLYNK